MSNTIMIPIPAPPDGWVFDAVRKVKHGEQVYDAGRWEVWEALDESTFEYPVAIPIPPKWTPPPEWAALFGHCWLTLDAHKETWVHNTRPEYNNGFWAGSARCCVSLFARPELLPPDDIPADQCCWEIGGCQ